jgi:hypothetical protein
MNPKTDRTIPKTNKPWKIDAILLFDNILITTNCYDPPYVPRSIQYAVRSYPLERFYREPLRARKHEWLNLHGPPYQPKTHEGC